MRSIKLSIIINTFFIFIATLFFFYAVFFYNGSGFTASILLSSIFSIIISGVYVLIALIKGEIIQNKYSLENLLSSFNYFLFLKTKTEILKLLEDYYSLKKIKTTIFDNYILLNKTNTQIYPLVKPEQITLSETIEIFKHSNQNGKIILLGVDFSSDILSTIKKLNLDISFIKTSEFYYALKESNLLPKIEIQETKRQKIDVASFFKKLFCKKNAKKFLITGIILTITSFFTFYPTYYIIVGSALMIISVVLRLKTEAQIKTKNALDNIVEK